MGVETARRTSDPAKRPHQRFWNGIAWIEIGPEAGLPLSGPPPVRVVAPRTPPGPVTWEMTPGQRPARGPNRLPSHRAQPSARRRAARMAGGLAVCLGAGLGLAIAIAAAVGLL